MAYAQDYHWAMGIYEINRGSDEVESLFVKGPLKDFYNSRRWSS
jgi:hypothetical protein